MQKFTVIVKALLETKVFRVEQSNEETALWEALEVGCGDPWLDSQPSSDPEVYSWIAQGGLYPSTYPLQAIVVDGWKTAQEVVDQGYLDRFCDAIDADLRAQGVRR